MQIYALTVIILFIFLIIGIICITINLVMDNIPPSKPQIIYRYMPKSLEDEQKERPFVSEIFNTMFTQQSPWINSIMDYDRRKQESVNKFYVSQV